MGHRAKTHAGEVHGVNVRCTQCRFRSFWAWMRVDLFKDGIAHCPIGHEAKVTAGVRHR